LPVAIALLLILPHLAQAWSDVGHRTIACIAEEQLTDRTKTQIRNILPAGETLVTIATWADEIRQVRPETAAWHYIDLPVRTTITITNLAFYCGTNDILFRVNACIDGLQNPALAPTDRRECLKSLVHFIGDLSMPLHCSDDDDRGGNDKIVRYYGHHGMWLRGEKIKLHALWDHVIRAEPHDDPRKLAKSLQAQIAPAQTKAWTTGGPREWALDTHAVSKSIVYNRLPPGPTRDGTAIRLPRRYFSMMRPVARMQLAKAGIRLATALNGVFDPAR